MSKLEDINLKFTPIDFKPFSDLMDVLTERLDELPIDLKDEVIEIVKAEDYSLIDSDYISANGFKFPVATSLDGEIDKHVLSVNKVLRCVKSINMDNNTINHSKPEHFKATDANGLVIVEW